MADESNLKVIRDSEKEPGTDNQNAQRGTFRVIATSPIIDDHFNTGAITGFTVGFQKRKSPICVSFYGQRAPYMFMSEISVGRGMVWHAAIDVGVDAVNTRGAVPESRRVSPVGRESNPGPRGGRGP